MLHYRVLGLSDRSVYGSIPIEYFNLHISVGDVNQWSLRLPNSRGRCPDVPRKISIDVPKEAPAIPDFVGSCAFRIQHLKDRRTINEFEDVLHVETFIIFNIGYPMDGILIRSNQSCGRVDLCWHK